MSLASGAFARSFQRAAERLVPVRDDEFDNPSLWCRRNIRYKEGEGLAFYQDEIMQNLVTYGREAVRGPHGLGKTTTAAHVILWFARTREAAGIDWKVVITASVWRQLEKYLWPEIHKWAMRLRPEVAFTATELFKLSIKLTNGSAFPVASDKHEAIEGAHADHILYVFDEAKAIPPDTYNAAEGAFSGGGAQAGLKAYALAISTPGEAVGRFYEIHSHAAGTEDWHTTHVTLEMAIKARRISRDWAEQRRLQWGELSAVYLNRVLGEFAAADLDGVIPSLSWIEAANERWRTIMDQVQAGEATLPELTMVAVDVARQGADKTVFAFRYEGFIDQLVEYEKNTTTETSTLLAEALGTSPEYAAKAGRYAMVDIIGLGAGVVDQTRQKGFVTHGFHAAEGTDLTDVSGELQFANKRAAGWWNVREVLDPANGFEVALPPDDQLTGDLLSPKWSQQPGGRIKVESKADIRKRLGRSPDKGDAIVMALWDPDNDQEGEQMRYGDSEGERVSISAY